MIENGFKIHREGNPLELFDGSKMRERMYIDGHWAISLVYHDSKYFGLNLDSMEYEKDNPYKGYLIELKKY